MKRGPDMPEIAALLGQRMSELATELTGARPTTQGRQEWRFRSKGSLAVVTGGPDRGSWFDHEAGCGGDALALVAHLRHVPMLSAWRWALGWLGLGEGAAAPATSWPRLVATAEAMPEATQPATLDMAQRLWCEAVAADAPGSLAPAYLAARGVALEAGAPLRFHPHCPRGAERWPAMLALMTDPATGEACGVHRTFLARDGSGKAPGALPAKMMAGRAGVVRLVPDEEVTGGLGLAEGIETALSVMQGFSWRPVWAATSAGMIRTLPVLPGIDALTIFADADGAGITAAAGCAARWMEAGAEARIVAAPAGQDFNDALRERAA
ncbi:toprim domain-containing protein [Belnapia sp. F-4-1]|uniref:DUF7146 domain-containing protein n=1 Tax=Belnapia sp. F-4-1 TaxID=1545443 RepID=UPI00068CCA6C|nr:toprim domain-containing protein [Belnapia sp. F-4-1]